MKLPKKVRVCAVEYDVKFPYIFKECDDRSAQHSYTDGTILVSSVNNDRIRDDQKILGSFLHELIHAIDSNFLSNELEEKQVEILGNCLYGILRYQNLEEIPSRIELVGLEYKVFYPYDFKETDEYFSFCDNSTCEIFINSKVNKWVARTSLFMQILSVFNNSYSIEIEVEDIKKLANGLVDTLDRNNLWKLFKR